MLEFKVGDIVECIDDGGSADQLTNGEFYKVSEIRFDGEYIKLAGKEDHHFFWPDRFKLHCPAGPFETAVTTEPLEDKKSNPFVVGDCVKFSSPFYSRDYPGTYAVCRVEGDLVYLAGSITSSDSYHWSHFDKSTVKEYVETSDNVSSPSHYNQSDIEAIEAIEASMSPEEYQGYLKGNCLKYLWRYKYKGKPLEDLKKAQWYLNKLIGEMDEN